jgi:hypothetical protein
MNPSAENETFYLECPRYKGRPRKHIQVCRSCRWQKGCTAYLRFRQPELPFRAMRPRHQINPPA